VYDLIIIGGGPSGINCAIEAQRAGLSNLVLEKGVLVNSLYHFPTNMTFFSTSKRLEIADIPFISHSDKPTRSEALEYYRRLVQHFGLRIRLYEPVVSMHPLPGDHYRLKTEKGQYDTRAVVVATGFYDTARKLNVPGEELPKVTHYYTDPHPYVGQDVLVVGAANSACDAALELWSHGANVTMAIRKGEIYKGVKYWIRPNIENRIKEGSIRALFHTTVEAIHPRSVRLQTPEGPLEVANDFVLAMTGYRPNFEFLRRLGIQIREIEAVTVPCHETESLETNLPGVYLAGVVCAGMDTSSLFIENTRDHARRIISQVRHNTVSSMK